MKTNSAIKPPVWFWIVSVIALLWNLIGVAAYLGQAYMTDEDLAALPETQKALYAVQPAWVTGAFAIAVWGGLLGCIALLLRRGWAHPVFLISLLGIMAQMGYVFFMSDTLTVMGKSAMIMPIVVVIIGVVLLFFARMANNRNWLV